MIVAILKTHKIATKQLKNTSIIKRGLNLMKNHEWNAKEKKEVNIVSRAPISGGCGPVLNLSLNSSQRGGILNELLRIIHNLRRRMFCSF
jgi:hypothetical protein